MPSGECTSTMDRPASGNTGRLFLTFGRLVCADRISNCPLDRVLTYKNFIYLLSSAGLKPGREIIKCILCVCVCALVCHADFSKTATATDFFVN